MVDFAKLLKKRREAGGRGCVSPTRERDASPTSRRPLDWTPTKQSAVEYPDTCPEFWDVELDELDAEGPHHVRVGHV